MRLIALLLLLLGSAAQTVEKPNILFIFADDQCFDTLKSMGNSEIMTPNLDRLVNEGTIFTHAYNMGSWSGAVCVASRAMLNTGRFVWRAKAVDPEKERQGGRFWSEYMKGAGYKTYMTGKWHVKAKAEKAFDVARDVRGGMPNQTKEGYNRPLGPDDKTWQPWDKKFGGFWKGGKHWSEIVGDHATDYLKMAAKDDKPFFMYIAFNAPHDPRQSPKKFVDMYPLNKISMPKSFVPEYPHKDTMGCGKSLRDEKLAPFPRTEYSVKVNRQEYYAIITHMDYQIGRILDELEKTGKKDNTWIFFTADHGLAVGNHGLMGKQNMYDHSLRVPFMVVGPGVKKNAKIDTKIYLQDVMPTSLELAGVSRPDHVEFKSIKPILDGKVKSQYDSIYGCYLTKQRAIIKDDFKLISYPGEKVFKLFNLTEDPQELKDLAALPQYKEKLSELKVALKKLQAEMGDSLTAK